MKSGLEIRETKSDKSFNKDNSKDFSIRSMTKYTMLKGKESVEIRVACAVDLQTNKNLNVLRGLVVSFPSIKIGYVIIP